MKISITNEIVEFAKKRGTPSNGFIRLKSLEETCARAYIFLASTGKGGGFFCISEGWKKQYDQNAQMGRQKKGRSNE